MPKRELTDDEKTLRAKLGAAIRMESGKQGLKPADLAQAAGIALSQQYRIENGEVTADFLYLVKVAPLLRVSLDDLLSTAVHGRPGAVPEQTAQSISMNNLTQVSSRPGSVQVGYAGGSVSVRGAKVNRSQPKSPPRKR